MNISVILKVISAELARHGITGTISDNILRNVEAALRQTMGDGIETRDGDTRG